VKRALIIETAQEDSALYVDQLAGEGFECTSLESAGDAARFLRDVEDLALIVLRWEIQGPPFAFELLFICKQTRPNTPVIIIAAVLDVSLAARAIAVGAYDFIQTPLDRLRFRRAVREATSTESSSSPLLPSLRQRIIGDSKELVHCLKQVALAIPHENIGILLLGESGTGKELIAQSIHLLSNRASRSMVSLNVGSISRELVESELFGHERGSFTGANQQHIGYLERVGSGTLLLDEIGDLPLMMQIKLLRVLQEKEFYRVGGTKPIPFTARLISATHVDLPYAVQSGEFRLDLYHRIAEVSIRVPALRDRGQDLSLLIDYFIDQMRPGKGVMIARETRTILKSYTFPGNVRELEKILTQALIASEGHLILPRHLPLDRMAPFASENSVLSAFTQVWPEDWLQAPHKDATRRVLQAFDRVYLKRAYDRAGGKISKAAVALGMDRGTFAVRWKECGLGETAEET
jgi:DNA-binding NtrC family response regulator